MRKRDTAFTLVELLIAVAILVVVVAIAIPEGMSFIKKGRIVTGNANAKALNEAILRARTLDGDRNSAISVTATNSTAAAEYLLSTGYLRN